MNHIPGSGCPFWLDLTPEQRHILADRARKHRALLHNQSIDLDAIGFGAEEGASEVKAQDTRVEESEVILDLLLRRYSIIRDDEQVEEIADVVKNTTTPPADLLQNSYLSITTNHQTIELPYTV